MTTRDSRDSLIETPAASGHALARRLAAYRELLSVALGLLHKVTGERDRLQERDRDRHDTSRRNTGSIP